MTWNHDACEHVDGHVGLGYVQGNEFGAERGGRRGCGKECDEGDGYNSLATTCQLNSAPRYCRPEKAPALPEASSLRSRRLKGG
jgi:hypothetical protein